MAVWTYPAIDPVIFELGPLAVRWYGVAYVTGFVLAAVVLWRLNRRWGLGIGVEQLLDIVLAAALGVVVGARLGYVLFYNLVFYLEEPVRIVAIWDGGMSFHGGLVGIMLAGVVMAPRLGVPVLRLWDAGAVGAPLGILFGRVANFINGELWGRVTDVPWGMVFPGAGPDPRHPSQLYEGLTEGLLAFVVLWGLARKQRPEGMLLGVFFVVYAVSRFAIEFVREPDAQLGLVLGPLTMGQLLTAPVLIAGVWLLARARRAGGGSVDPGSA